MQEIKKHIFAIIMAGGGGERFWPKSRQAHPKQLLGLFGKRTMIQETVDRISRLVPKERIIIITTKIQAPLVREQLAGVPPSSVIPEPFGRDTAPCIALAAALVMERDPEGIMLVVPSDHVIRDARRLVSTLWDACRVAWQHGCLVTLGIRPTGPVTGYGYIRRGKRLPYRFRTRFASVREFTEKPDRARALRYVRSGKYFWNSGMFVWKASVIAEELKAHMPALYRGYLAIRATPEGPIRDRTVRQVYRGLKRVSIDYGVMEKARDVVVAEADFDWDDAGSWLAFERHFPRGRDGNVVLGESIALDTERCIIISDEGIVGCLGLKDLIVVRSKGAVLVCHRDAAQDLKKIVQRLKSQKRWREHT